MRQLPEGLEQIVTGERFRKALGLPDRVEENYELLAQKQNDKTVGGRKMRQLPEGLEQIVTGERFRKALGLPDRVEENYELLAQGEYNRNFLFIHPVTGKKLILRLNFGSQMHLEHQIEYEYQALCLLKDSGRTPKPLYVDGSRQTSDQGFLVMEFLPGRALDYRKDLLSAAFVCGWKQADFRPGISGDGISAGPGT